MAPPAFDTGKPVKLVLNGCWMFTSVLMGLFMMMVFFGPRGDKTDAEPLDGLGDYRVWDSEHLCACDWIDEGRTIDPACPGNSTHGAQGKVQATIAELGEREVGGAGGHADTAAEEVMSMDLPYPKSGHWDKQVRCDLCSEGRSACGGSSAWTSGILGFLCGLCVFAMFCFCMSYVGWFVPGERKEKLTPILIAHTCCSKCSSSVLRLFSLPQSCSRRLLHGHHSRLHHHAHVRRAHLPAPARPSRHHNVFIMGIPLWLGWVTSTKIWEDKDGGDSG